MEYRYDHHLHTRRWNIVMIITYTLTPPQQRPSFPFNHCHSYTHISPWLTHCDLVIYHYLHVMSCHVPVRLFPWTQKWRRFVPLIIWPPSSDTNTTNIPCHVTSRHVMSRHVTSPTTVGYIYLHSQQRYHHLPSRHRHFSTTYRGHCRKYVSDGERRVGSFGQ